MFNLLDSHELHCPYQEEKERTWVWPWPWSPVCLRVIKKKEEKLYDLSWCLSFTLIHTKSGKGEVSKRHTNHRKWRFPIKTECPSNVLNIIWVSSHCNWDLKFWSLSVIKLPLKTWKEEGEASWWWLARWWEAVSAGRQGAGWTEEGQIVVSVLSRLCL